MPKVNRPPVWLGIDNSMLVLTIELDYLPALQFYGFLLSVWVLFFGPLIQVRVTLFVSPGTFSKIDGARMKIGVGIISMPVDSASSQGDEAQVGRWENLLTKLPEILVLKCRPRNKNLVLKRPFHP
jgi:hypothetical protein